MRPMQEDAMDKVKQGVTTLDEVMRVVPFEHELAVRCPECGKGLAATFLFCPYCGAGTRKEGGGRRAAGAPASQTGGAG